MSSCVSGFISMRRMMPLRRIIGASPTLRCRSLPSCFMTMRNSLLTSGSRRASAGTRGCAAWTSSASAVAIRTLQVVSGEHPLPTTHHSHRYAALGEVRLGRGDAVFVVMKDARGQGGVGATGGQHLIEVLWTAGAATGHHRD